MEYLIRPAAPEHLPQCVTLLHDLFGVEKDFTPDAERQREGLRLLLDAPDAMLLVAVADTPGALVAGMATAQCVISTAQGGYSLLVEDVVVHNAFRRQKIATKLLSRLAEWGKTRGASRMQLLADKHNPPALALYNALGWQQTDLVAIRTGISTAPYV